MPSNAESGARYKARSKKWLQERGHAVADMELIRTVFKRDGVVFTKRDQLGADLLYIDLRADRVVFVQVKGGLKPVKDLIASARRGFDGFALPTTARKEVHVWQPRARVPIVEVLP